MPPVGFQLSRHKVKKYSLHRADLFFVQQSIGPIVLSSIVGVVLWTNYTQWRRKITKLRKSGEILKRPTLWSRESFLATVRDEGIDHLSSRLDVGRSLRRFRILVDP